MRRIASIFAYICALLGASGASAQPSASLQPVRIEVPAATNLQFLALWVAIGGGCFEKEGLKPQIIVAASPRETGQLMLHGGAEVALLPPPMFLGYIEEHEPIQLFASLLANEPINIVVSGQAANARNLSAKVSLKERLLALKGLKIGLASEVTPRLKAIYDAAGLDVGKDITRVVIAGPDQVQAFADGKVDALFAHTPYLETALTEHHGFLVVEASHGEVAALADGEIHTLATSKETAAKNPVMIERVRRAIADAEAIIHSSPETTLRALAAYGAIHEPEKALSTIVAIYGPAVPRTPAVSVAAIQHDAQLYPAHPKAPDFTKVRTADFVLTLN